MKVELLAFVPNTQKLEFVEVDLSIFGAEDNPISSGLDDYYTAQDLLLALRADEAKIEEGIKKVHKNTTLYTTLESRLEGIKSNVKKAEINLAAKCAGMSWC